MQAGVQAAGANKGTFDLVAYDKLGEMAQSYQHHRINHSEKIYVMGHVHANTLKGSGVY
jgi:hypothetical protein